MVLLMDTLRISYKAHRCLQSQKDRQEKYFMGASKVNRKT